MILTFPAAPLSPSPTISTHLERGLICWHFFVNAAEISVLIRFSGLSVFISGPGQLTAALFACRWRRLRLHGLPLLWYDLTLLVHLRSRVEQPSNSRLMAGGQRHMADTFMLGSVAFAFVSTSLSSFVAASAYTGKGPWGDNVSAAA